MGKTSVKTACNPRFLRLEGGWSACKNSLYELVCNSIRLGGAMISLIFPKLILSIARDGIGTFFQWLGRGAGPLVTAKHQKARTPRSKSELAEHKPLAWLRWNFPV